jgi:hypothetical protein
MLVDDITEIDATLIVVNLADDRSVLQRVWAVFRL